MLAITASSLCLALDGFSTELFNVFSLRALFVLAQCSASYCFCVVVGAKMILIVVFVCLVLFCRKGIESVDG